MTKTIEETTSFLEAVGILSQHLAKHGIQANPWESPKVDGILELYPESNAIRSYLSDVGDYVLLRTRSKTTRNTGTPADDFARIVADTVANCATMPKGIRTAFQGTSGSSLAVSLAPPGLWHRGGWRDGGEVVVADGVDGAVVASYPPLYSAGVPDDVDFLLALDSSNLASRRVAQDLVEAGAFLLCDWEESIPGGKAVVTGKNMQIKAHGGAWTQRCDVDSMYDWTQIPESTKRFLDSHATYAHLKRAVNRFWENAKVGTSYTYRNINVFDEPAIRYMRLFADLFTFGKLASHGFAVPDEWNFSIPFPDKFGQSPSIPMKRISPKAFATPVGVPSLPLNSECYGYAGQAFQMPVTQAVTAAGDCARIWEHVLSRSGLSMSLTIAPERDKQLIETISELRATGQAIGIDTAVEAYLSGIPLSHVIEN